MTAPLGAIAEAEKALAQFQAALLRLGIVAIAEAIKRWRQLPPTKAAEQAEDWLEDAVHLVMTRRSQSRELAVAYYRLARALRTGTTIPDPYNPIPRVVTLGDLRREFALLTESTRQPSDSAPEPVEGTAPPLDTPDDSADTQGSEDDDLEIPIEEIDGITEDGDEEAERIEREAEDQARVVLATLGPNLLTRKIKEIDTRRPADEVDSLRDEAHDKAGARQAAAADRLVKNGARDVVHSLGERDKRAIGYVRVSQTGTPCGWCAMLISRGVFFYKSKRTAERAEDGSLYHDNCNCVGEPVYSMSAYENDPLFAMNREYSRLWPVVTKGSTDKAALTKWRRYFRQKQAEENANSGKAQAA